jgi:hypothetical protein
VTIESNAIDVEIQRMRRTQKHAKYGKATRIQLDRKSDGEV